MSKLNQKRTVIEEVRKWTTTGNDSPSLLISLDTGCFHLGFYSGMGNSDNTPLEQLDPKFKKTVLHLYKTGQLIESGNTFTLYPGSDLFKRLIFSKPYSPY